MGRLTPLGLAALLVALSVAIAVVTDAIGIGWAWAFIFGAVVAALVLLADRRD